MTRTVGELSHVMLDAGSGRRIGYVTDARFTWPNLQALAPLLAGVDQLFIESVFLHQDEAQARRKNHLTARQAGWIARRVGARWVVPFHFSPRYRENGRAAEVAAEVQEAFSDPLVVARPAGAP